MSHEIEAYTIGSFCQVHSISKGAFYKLKKIGKTPQLYYIGRKPYISREAAIEWRKQMQSDCAEYIA